MERRVAIDSGQVIESRSEGLVTSVTAENIVVTDKDGNDFHHELYKYRRSRGPFQKKRPAGGSAATVTESSSSE